MPFVCAQSCLTLCDPMDCSLPGSSVLGILQGRIPDWVAMPSSRGSSQPRDWTHVSCTSCSGRQILYCWATGEACWVARRILIPSPGMEAVHPEWNRRALSAGRTGSPCISSAELLGRECWLILERNFAATTAASHDWLTDCRCCVSVKICSDRCCLRCSSRQPRSGGVGLFMSQGTEKGGVARWGRSWLLTVVQIETMASWPLW